MTSSWFFLSTLKYDARSTTHQISTLKYDARSTTHQISTLKYDARSATHQINTYLCLQVKCPTFLILTKSELFRSIFMKSRISRFEVKSVQWDPQGQVDCRRDRRAQTDGHDAVNRRFSRLCKRFYTCLNVTSLRK